MPGPGVGLLCSRLRSPPAWELFAAVPGADTQCLQGLVWEMSGIAPEPWGGFAQSGDTPVGTDVLQQWREISSSRHTPSSLPLPWNPPDASLALVSDPAFPFPQGLEAHKYKNTWDCAYQIMKHEGPLA